MRFPHAALLLATTFAVGCAEGAEPAGLPTPDAAPAVAGLDLPFSRADDRRVHLRAGGWLGTGSVEGEAARADLAPARLEALDRLRLVKPTSDSCPADLGGYALTITRAGGEMVKAIGTPHWACGSQPAVLEPASIVAFVETLGCVATNVSAERLERAPTIRPDDGCRHGISSTTEGPPSWMKLEIPTPGRYEVGFSACAGKATALELLDASGATRLAADQGTGEGEAGCARIVHTFDAAGTYVVKLATHSTTGGGQAHVLLDLRTTK